MLGGVLCYYYAACSSLSITGGMGERKPRGSIPSSLWFATQVCRLALTELEVAVSPDVVTGLRIDVVPPAPVPVVAVELEAFPVLTMQTVPGYVVDESFSMRMVSARRL